MKKTTAKPVKPKPAVNAKEEEEAVLKLEESRKYLASKLPVKQPSPKAT